MKERITQRRQLWGSEIKKEKETLRVLVWFIKAMLITQCCFATTASEGSHQCSMIEDLERYKIASSINDAAISIYNDFYRSSHRRAVITNHQNPSLSGKTVQIDHYDQERSAYWVCLITDQSSAMAIDPGNLTSLSLSSIFADKLQHVSLTRDIVLRSTDESTESHTVHFDLGCFKAFYPFFDQSKLIQSDAVYRTIRLLTDTVQNTRESRALDRENERESLMRSLSALGHQEMIDSLLKNDPFEHMFTFPFKSNDLLYNSGRHVGIFDHGLDTQFDPKAFCMILNQRRSHPVDGTALRSLLPQQSLNDGAMNVLMTWYVCFRSHVMSSIPILTNHLGSLLCATTSICSTRVFSPNF